MSKQIEGFIIGGPLSVTVVGVHVIRARTKQLYHIILYFIEGILMILLIVMKRTYRMRYSLRFGNTIKRSKKKLTIESNVYEKPTNLPCIFLSDLKMQLAGIYIVKIRVGTNF